jgi:predicted nucleic acid-binding protein
MKVVLDANVVVSAILFGGTPRIILESAFEGTLQVYISDEIIEELEKASGGQSLV